MCVLTNKLSRERHKIALATGRTSSSRAWTAIAFESVMQTLGVLQTFILSSGKLEIDLIVVSQELNVQVLYYLHTDNESNKRPHLRFTIQQSLCVVLSTSHSLSDND